MLPKVHCHNNMTWSHLSIAQITVFFCVWFISGYHILDKLLPSNNIESSTRLSDVPYKNINHTTANLKLKNDSLS